MDTLSFRNPVFATYAIAASIMILKAVAMSWLTVARMMQVKGGFRSPEDLKKTILNPAPDPAQLAANNTSIASEGYISTISKICRSFWSPACSLS
jgi:glutathione S-transferase